MKIDEFLMHVLWRHTLEFRNMAALLFEWGEITNSIGISRVNKIVFSREEQKHLEIIVTFLSTYFVYILHLQKDFHEEDVDN
jgi:hypothetical protein